MNKWNDTNGVSNILGIGEMGDRTVSSFLGIRGGMHNRVSNTKNGRGVRVGVVPTDQCFSRETI